MAREQLRIGIIGGTGFYDLFPEAGTGIDTPYGPASGPVSVGELGGVPAAFVARHGADHRFPPHLVPYRANLWALHSLGVRHVLAVCAVGSLSREIRPGDFVVPDQIVDRTYGRDHTYFDGDGRAGLGDGVHHVQFADPYSGEGRECAVAACRTAADEFDVHDGGTLVVVNGPRFSTRAESLDYSSRGWDIIGMTGMPEAVLAAELGLRYTTVALVTDRDAGIATGDAVTHEHVVAQVALNVSRMRTLAERLVPALHAISGAGGSAVKPDE